MRNGCFWSRARRQREVDIRTCFGTLLLQIVVAGNARGSDWWGALAAAAASSWALWLGSRRSASERRRRGHHGQGRARPSHHGQGPMPLVAGVDVAASSSSSSSSLQWGCPPSPTPHDSEKKASTTAPKKAPGVARRLQLQVW